MPDMCGLKIINPTHALLMLQLLLVVVVVVNSDISGAVTMTQRPGC